MRKRSTSILMYLLVITAIFTPLILVFLVTRPKINSETVATQIPSTSKIEVVSKLTGPETEKEYLEIPHDLGQFITTIERQTDVLEISLTTNQTALVSAEKERHPIELRRLLAILQGFSFESIEEPISEIDVRYKLPVLRTTKSTQQIRSEFLLPETQQNEEMFTPNTNIEKNDAVATISAEQTDTALDR